MQTSTIENTEFRTSIPVREKSGERFIFYTGDVISPSSKTKNPSWRKGGIVLGYDVLKHTNGFVQRCKITSVRDHFHAEYKGFIDPQKQESYVQSYTQFENGRAQEIGRISDGQGGSRPDGLLRKPIYPVNSVARIVGEVPGVVEMPITSSADTERINDFLMKGLEAGCPTRIDDLRAHFVKRLNSAQTELERACAAAAIQSCEDYKAYQTEQLDIKLKRYDSSQKKGHPYTFGGRAELLFEQLNVERPDRAASAQRGQMDDLTKNINRLAEIQIRNAENANVQPSASEMQKIAELEAEIARLRHERDIETAIKMEQPKTEDTVNFEMNQSVQVGDRVGKITGKHFGKIKVQFDDDSTPEILTVEKSQVKVIE